MNRSVIAIGLDAADPTLIEKWGEEGHLPVLSRQKSQGAYALLDNFEFTKAETPWTTVLTGCAPEKTKFWGPLRFCAKTYNVVEDQTSSYDFKEYSPFFALGEQYRIAVFDVPHSKLSDNVNGLQVLGWGAHSPFCPSHSNPPHLYQELVARHGVHPAFLKDHADPCRPDTLTWLEGALSEGIKRRREICIDLVKRERWSLFLMTFGETHSGGHVFYHLSQPDHPLYGLVKIPTGDALLTIYKAVDHAIGEILKHLPEDATVCIFSAHGMEANNLDVPSLIFLPELLYRFAFPGKVALGGNGNGAAVEPTVIDRNVFLMREWPSGLHFPSELRNQKDTLWWSPAQWYKRSWPRMKAFALPSYADGAVRINLEGRESHGLVAREQYDQFCEKLAKLISNLRDARTGRPMVKEVLRVRTAATADDAQLPEADLIVIWENEPVADVVECPGLGRIGPVPYLRTGAHRPYGFLNIVGPGIPQGSRLPRGHALDITPTILSLMGTKIPPYMDGKALI
jgi:predicted AlkP superfamily phosphohydrolase/phosphomutase